MSNFGEFTTSNINQSTSSQSQVDYDGLHKYVVESAGIEEQKTKIGIITGIVDLGEQPMPNSEFIFDGTDKDGNPITEEQIIAEKPYITFKDRYDKQKKKNVRLISYPQKPIQNIAIVVDFPTIVLDQGQFYGKSNPKPLRMILGGQFYDKDTKKMYVNYPTSLKLTKNKDNKWSFSPKHLLYRMAKSVYPTPLIKNGDVFLPKNINDLIGKAFLFEVQVFFKKGNDGKDYFTKRINFQGSLAEGMKIPKLPSNVEEFYIGFNKQDSKRNIIPNTEKSIKELPNYILNTIKRALNYSGSQIEKDINKFIYNRSESVIENSEVDNNIEPDEPDSTEKPKTISRKEKVSKEEINESENELNFEDFDNDIPF